MSLALTFLALCCAMTVGSSAAPAVKRTAFDHVSISPLNPQRGDTVTVRARLTYQEPSQTWKPLPNKQVKFTIRSNVLGSVKTSKDGFASVSFLLEGPQYKADGQQTIGVTFAGDAGFKGCTTQIKIRPR